MTKKELNLVLDKLDKYAKTRIDFNEAVEKCFKVIAPSSNTPYMEFSLEGAFIDGVSIQNPWLQEELEYYTYEARNMKRKATITYKDKEYDATDREQFVNYLIQIQKK